MRNLLLSGIALGVAATVAGSAAWADMQVAVVGPITGQYAAFGEQMKRGLEMAVKDLNAAGGVNGEEVVAVTEDAACDPKQAVAAANNLVGEGPGMVAGHFCACSSIPASPVYYEE